MEQELFLSGYCRQIDQNRMVTLVIAGGELEEVDCCYENCIYAPNCTVAQKIREALNT